MTPPIPHVIRSGIEYKVCNRCKKELELVCYGKNSRSHDKLRGTCKACRSPKPFFEANPNSTTKVCCDCEVRKDKSEFRGNRGQCRDCEKVSGREYRRTHKEKNQKWVADNRERMSELQHSWYEENKPQIRDEFNRRMREEPEFRKIKSYRNALNKMLRGERKTNKHLGCSAKELWTWFEFLFEDGMSKENYVEMWVVDHVIPLAFLNTSPKIFTQLTRWYNVAPFPRLSNLRKNQYIDVGQLKKHLEKLVLFCKLKKIPLDQKYVDLCATQLEVRESPHFVAPPPPPPPDMKLVELLSRPAPPIPAPLELLEA